jgi:Methyltransferase domain
MDYASFVSEIGFTILQPDYYPTRDEQSRLSEMAIARNIPFDMMNTTLPENEVGVKQTLDRVCRMPRMSTFAIGAMINRAVAQMSADAVFLNIGVWNGFSLLAGMAANEDKACIGVDNFSEFGGPRSQFLQRFERQRGTRHTFREMDYRAYFEHEHRAPIGVYFYDGDHSYEHQLLGLQMAEPYLTDDCIIFVDDTNSQAPRAATYAFLSEHGGYRVLLDGRTCANGHPTWWNGIVVVQRGK